MIATLEAESREALDAYRELLRSLNDFSLYYGSNWLLPDGPADTALPEQLFLAFCTVRAVRCPSGSPLQAAFEDVLGSLWQKGLQYDRSDFLSSCSRSSIERIVLAKNIQLDRVSDLLREAEASAATIEAQLENAKPAGSKRKGRKQSTSSDSTEKHRDRFQRAIAYTTCEPEMTGGELASKLGITRRTLYRDPLLRRVMKGR